MLMPLALVLLTQTPEQPDGPVRWRDEETFTGRWYGQREDLASHGLTIDLAYTAETFVSSARLATDRRSVALLGHIDAALTLDTKLMGLWRGGKLYVLGQHNHGTSINDLVGSITEISSLEAPPYTQLTELFYEQVLFGDLIRIRLGKQDANRDFGTPRFGGNFLNNNFGMLPTAPLPSYPTTGLGVTLAVQPTWWLALKAAIYEGSPQVGSLGFDSALVENAGLTGVGGITVAHRFGPNGAQGGTAMVGAWLQTGEIDGVGVPAPQMFGNNVGVMVQLEEHLLLDPSDPQATSGLNVAARVGWAQPDRNEIPLYVGAALAWHGLGQRRDNDTVGLGFGYLQVNPAAGQGFETFVEVFYKARLTKFLSLQPDAQVYVHPGGDAPTTLILGLRVKLKL